MAISVSHGARFGISLKIGISSRSEGEESVVDAELDLGVNATQILLSINGFRNNFLTVHPAFSRRFQRHQSNITTFADNCLQISNLSLNPLLALDLTLCLFSSLFGEHI